MSWTRCVRHLVYCFCQDEAVPYQSVAGAPDTPILIENLSHDKALVIFWFAATLVDEVGKTDSSAMKQLSDFLTSRPYSLTCTRHKFHRRVVPNVTDIVPLIEKYISSDSPTLQLDIKARQEAMRCFQVRTYTYLLLDKG
jgi:hypothetical protein